MAYLTLQINAPGVNVGDFNTAINGGATKPEEVLANIHNILSAVQGGLQSATVIVQSSTAADAIAAPTGGTGPFTLNLL